MTQLDNSNFFWKSVLWELDKSTSYAKMLLKEGSRHKDCFKVRYLLSLKDILAMTLHLTMIKLHELHV